MIKRVITFGVIIFIVSCGSKNKIPEEILPPAKMQILFWDVLQADAFAFTYVTKDTTKKPEAEVAKLQQQIFSIHKTTKDIFYKSYEYYNIHPEIMKPLLDSMISKYTNEKYAHTKGKNSPVKDSITPK